MSNFNFSSDIPEEIKNLVDQNLRAMINNVGLVRKIFYIETFKNSEETENERLIVKTENNKTGIIEYESFYILINKNDPQIIEFVFNSNSFYSPSRYMNDFDDIDEIKHNALILFNRIIDLIKDRKNYLIHLNSYFKNRELFHKIVIQKSDKILNQIEISEKDVELALTKGFSGFLVKFKLDQLVA